LPSFILDQLEQMEEGEDEEDLKGAAATMFAAGEATVGFFLKHRSPSHRAFPDVEFTLHIRSRDGSEPRLPG
jgi:hypothetical protein